MFAFYRDDGTRLYSIAGARTYTYVCVYVRMETLSPRGDFAGRRGWHAARLSPEVIAVYAVAIESETYSEVVVIRVREMLRRSRRERLAKRSV